ncbi:MAG: PLDc_N domain-containing protein [Chloroflexales bacterium]|nr:PLDc_N domain-containing protein [Chloroflexales bacterium]
MQHKRWMDLSPAQRRLIIALASLQFSLLVAALVDIIRRPAEQINGSKWAWAAASLLSIVGPLAYFRFGRRRQGQTEISSVEG